MSKEELCVVTEQGVFGELNIADPSKRKVQTKEEIDELIRQKTAENANITK